MGPRGRERDAGNSATGSAVVWRRKNWTASQVMESLFTAATGVSLGGGESPRCRRASRVHGKTGREFLQPHHPQPA